MHKFLVELSSLIKREFPDEKVVNLVFLPLALTTIAYKLEFESGQKYIVKIGFDSKDIAKGKGDKEQKSLKLAAHQLPEREVPQVIKYFKTYRGFPGYVNIITCLPGVVLPEDEFKTIALSQENLRKVVSWFQKLHEYKSDRFDDLTPNGTADFSAYIANEITQIWAAVEATPEISEILSGVWDKLAKVQKHFAGFKDFRFIHGDLNYKNVLVEQGKITGLIDWDRSMCGPIAFEFAHVSTLAEKYGLEEWHRTVRELYFAEYQGDKAKLKEDFRHAELFIYCKLLLRKLTHVHQKDTLEVVAHTGEEFRNHLVRKIVEFELR